RSSLVAGPCTRKPETTRSASETLTFAGACSFAAWALEYQPSRGGKLGPSSAAKVGSRKTGLREKRAEKCRKIGWITRTPAVAGVLDDQLSNVTALVLKDMAGRDVRDVPGVLDDQLSNVTA